LAPFSSEILAAITPFIFSLNEAICFIDGLAAFPTHWDKNPTTETTEGDYNTSKNARQENL